MRADSYQDVGTVATASQQSEAQLRTAAVKRREAFAPFAFTCVRTSSHPSHSSHLPQGICRGGVLVFCLCVWCCGFLVRLLGCFCWFVWVLFLVSLCFLHALALSLTGAQRTDSSFASKKNFNLQWKACVVTIELTPRGKKSEVRSSASSVVLWFVSSALFGVFLPRVVLAGYLDFMMRGTCGFPTQWL